MELDDDECRELYIFLAENEDRLSDILYSLNLRLEKKMFQKFTIGEIEMMKNRGKSDSEKC
ncbi:MAG: hypothetical protein MJ215_03025 [Spirochaetia bacterium]|nr:hypothetical protein [Spirochaetia bacterium]